MTDEEKKAIKVINKRTERLSEELKIEQEDFIDEPRIAYLITQIEANETLLKLLEKQEKAIDRMAEYMCNNIYFEDLQCFDKPKEKIKEYFMEDKE